MSELALKLINETEERRLFFNTYKNCGDAKALAIIWRAKYKQKNYIQLDFIGCDLKNLSPFAILKNLHSLKIYNSINLSQLDKLPNLHNLQRLQIGLKIR